ncbi:hypothetical protein PBAL39_11672 [Pedobacter sp. BAL39]|nr:hypothetical protein [Pedobacter sp. BAL39]EDM36361.1 hypothetical protein PBAL39_11672 [Pedobacter sp. BAL39]
MQITHFSHNTISAPKSQAIFMTGINKGKITAASQNDAGQEKVLLLAFK